MNENKVLIVDDNQDFADGLAEFLELFGHQVDVTFTGESGIDAVVSNTYDAILVDIGLPGLNGIESLLKIRQTGTKARCFLMTGYSADHIAAQGIGAGAVEILTKPIDLEELLQQIGDIENAG